jgi:hypothetical protein
MLLRYAFQVVIIQSPPPQIPLEKSPVPSPWTPKRRTLANIALETDTNAQITNG